VFGGGPIVGVVSASKKDTIREFNHKHKYNEWQFVYDPTLDRGGLIMTPNQPALQLGGTPPSQIGQPAGSNSSSSSFGQSGFGQSSSFGQSSGFGNNNSGLTNGTSTPAQPPSNAPPVIAGHADLQERRKASSSDEAICCSRQLNREGTKETRR
jgi:hypothetical protein